MRRPFALALAGLAGMLAGPACSSDEEGGTVPDAASVPAASMPTPDEPGPPSSTTPVSLFVPVPEISGDAPPRPEELDLPNGPTVCLLLSVDEVAAAIGADVRSSSSPSCSPRRAPRPPTSATGEW